ncbi:hypothetical protein JAAARDRAFT_453085 [Jaapia argillacea MUCL 33604]|uniref:Homeobox domain-containing protein n=1 Tax=Jaapia argillacea MUCL 33604 TaxID=933084 RepID=A0A067Q5B7_9AGAM|nr:hypothetical protein JAAARDRAFT_453085 [Jaapia argillacea MUCL 33604]
MSSSAASAADSDISRPEKRPRSPSETPEAKRRRPTISVDQNAWSSSSASPQPAPASIPDKPLSGDTPADGSKVQLPSIFSTFEDPYRHEYRRASLPTLHSESTASRVRLPYPASGTRGTLGSSAQPSGLASYQFPNTQSSDPSPLPQDSISGRPSPSYVSTPSTFNSPLSPEYVSRAPASSVNQHINPWASPIIRPNSTPGQLGSGASVKYDDSIRHSSLGAPLAEHQMFGGATRISGQDRSRSSLPTSAQATNIKTEWTFPNNTELVMPSVPAYSSAPSQPSIAVPASPTHSPQPGPSPLVERPPRKRGKLPKHVTDFLKDWLHRHSDHPYPSEEEKKQLCHATGLSMSQVSNWMINARRRILAPAQRAASNPSTSHPYSTARSGSSTSALMQAGGRRASVPTDSLQLYHPMSLQSLPATHTSDYLTSSARHMMGVPRSNSSPYGMEYAQTSNRLSYVPTQHSSGHYLPSGVPMSAPAAITSGPYNSHGTYQQQALYAQQTQHHSPTPPSSSAPIPSTYMSGSHGSGNSRLSGQGSGAPHPQSQPQHDQSQRYYSDGPSQPGSAPGSGYPTPQ